LSRLAARRTSRAGRNACLNCLPGMLRQRTANPAWFP